MTDRRFEFGRNWAGFLARLDEDRIAEAERSLRIMLAMDGLEGKTFLDVGSGSGLFSLAARRLGAKVHSFDLDDRSVACAQSLKDAYFPEDEGWTIGQGSVLDARYLAALGTFDIVYSWGVLHHTGSMWEAMGNLPPLLRKEGRLFIAIYNDQGWKSVCWKKVKELYNGTRIGRAAILLFFTPYFVGCRYVSKRLTRRGNVERGMSLWHDMVDWLGGYPFEVAAPEAVSRFFRNRGLVLDRVKTAGGQLGCNEFVFRYPGEKGADA